MSSAIKRQDLQELASMAYWIMHRSIRKEAPWRESSIDQWFEYCEALMPKNHQSLTGSEK